MAKNGGSRKIILAKVLIGVLVCSLLCPSMSHAFGLLRYTFDAIANQLGLDRGPIPKTLPRTPPGALYPHRAPLTECPDGQRVYIQAEGF
ncbi:MAG: hypothetical protein WBG50_14410 [Desulfomonilaceae bacterium]